MQTNHIAEVDLEEGIVFIQVGDYTGDTIQTRKVDATFFVDFCESRPVSMGIHFDPEDLS
jgi:hypothetical protein